MMWGNGMGWGGWLLMTLTTVAFWALVVFGIVALFRGTSGSGPRDRDPERGARQILDEAVRPRRDRRRGVQLAAEPAAPTALMAPRGRAPSGRRLWEPGNRPRAPAGHGQRRQHSPTDPAAVRASPFRIPPRKKQ